MSIKTDETRPRAVPKRLEREEPALRAIQILDAAVRLSEQIGYTNITRDKVAAEAGCSLGLITHYYSTMNILQRAVMSAAISRKNLNIIAQGLALGHPKAQRAPQELRIAAAASITGE